MSDHDLRTQVIHAGEIRPRYAGAVVTPIFQSATFEFRGTDPDEPLRYLRYNNAPNHDQLHRKLARLEHADDALVTASGMAAISTALLSVLESGDHLLVQDTLYGGTAKLVARELPRFGIAVDRFDGRDPDTLEALARPETKAVYTEALTNPLVQVPDHPAIVDAARRHGWTSLIDSTFATPVNFRPADLGYDLVLHSGTKYLGGHADIIAGAIVGRRDLVARAADLAHSLGASLDPHACFLLDRGLKTLVLRMKAHNAGALRLAEHLALRPDVERVHHPGLADHPDHARAKALLRGCGGVLAFDLRGGAPAAERLCENLELMTVAPSLGGVETLVSRPMLTSHAMLDPDARRALGIADGQVRIAVGIEHPEDLIADLEQAFSAV